MTLTYENETDGNYAQTIYVHCQNLLNDGVKE